MDLMYAYQYGMCVNKLNVRIVWDDIFCFAAISMIYIMRTMKIQTKNFLQDKPTKKQTNKKTS